MITVIGLGPGTLETLTVESLRLLESAPRLLIRTERHPAVRELASRGVRFTALDSVYDSAPSVDEVYPRLADAVLEEARKGPVVYAVPGHPLVGEESVRILCRRAAEERLLLRVHPAVSFIDSVLIALAEAGETEPGLDIQVVDASAPGPFTHHPDRAALLYQVDDALTASDAKVRLMELYPDDHPVSVISHAGMPGLQRVARVALFEMDRRSAGAYDHLTTVYIPPLDRSGARPDFQAFVDVIARLRAPDGCPWDREQNRETLKRFVLEEAYEVLEAVDSGDPVQLCDELGDLMIQVLMYAQFAREDGEFDIQDVIANVVEKLVRRHPHVFGDTTAETSEEVLRNWERIKKTERPERESVLDGVPKHLPALMKAAEVSKRVVRVGFEWPVLEDVFSKLDEEIGELKDAVSGGVEAADSQRDEIGDLLFTTVNIARWLELDPEEALRTMVERFSLRFREVERLARQESRPLSDMNIQELDSLWDRAKMTLAGRQAG